MSTYLNPLFLLLFLALAACQTAATEEAGTTDDAETAVAAYIPATSASEEALAHYHTARELVENGHSEQARASLDQAIEMDPNFAMAHLLRGLLSLSPEAYRQRVEKALALADQVSEAERVMIRMYETGLRADAKQRLTMAKQLVELKPEVAEAYEELGWAYVANDQHDQAREAFRQAIALAPKWVVPYQALAGSLLYEEPKDIAAAQENLEKAVALAPANVEVQIDLGDTYRMQNQLDQARTVYRKAIELDPEADAPHLYLGRVNTLLGNYDEARKNFQTHRELSPDSKIASLHALAYIPLYQGNPDQAIAELRQSLDRLAELGIPEAQRTQAKMSLYNDLFWIAVHQNDPDMVAGIVDPLKPLFAQMSDEIGTAEAKAYFGAQETSLKSMLAALRDQPDEAKRLAEQYKSAISGIQNDNMIKGYHLNMGYNALRQKDYTTAIEHLKQSNTNFAYAKYLLAQAYEGAGEEEKSLALLNELSTLNYSGVGYALIRKEVKEQLMPS